jgi:hypothetical protein
MVGDSHLGAIKRAYDVAPVGQIAFRPIGAGSIVYEKFFRVDEAKGKVIVKTRRLGQIRLPLDTEDTGADAVYAISLPLNTSRILRDYDWRNYVPWNLVRKASEKPLSDEAVLRLIRSDTDRAIAFAEALADRGLEVIVIEAPMFFEDAPYLSRQRLDVCLEVARRYCDYVIGRLSARKIRVARQPRSTLTKDGTTDMAYHHEKPNDIHHGNTIFGVAMLQEIARMAGTKEESRAALSA